MSIGEKIKEQRELHQQSQEDVAKAIGTTKQNIYKYENGLIANIPLDKIESLAQHFNVSPSYLAGWDQSSSLRSDTHSIASQNSSELTEFLTLFRKLTPEEKKMLIAQMRGLAGNR